MKKIPNYMRKIINEKYPDFIDDGLNNCIDDFRYQDDLLDNYKPWYSYIVNKIKGNG
jgi:hypothetical protein